MRGSYVASLALCAALLVSASAGAQSPPPAPAAPPPPTFYGAPLKLEQAMTVAAAAEAEAKKNNWLQVVAIVDPSGALVYYAKTDGTTYAHGALAEAKARAAATFRSSTKSYQDRLAAGQTYILSLPGMIPVEGGVPIIIDGKVVGAIGISGGSPAQDGQVALAGVAALK